MFNFQALLKDLLHIRVLTREIVTTVDSDRNLLIQPCMGMGVFKYVKNAKIKGHTVFDFDDIYAIITDTCVELVSYYTIAIVDSDADEGLFENTNFSSIDLGYANTRWLKSMYRMFYGAQARSINLYDLDLSSVRNMCATFAQSKVENIYADLHGEPYPYTLHKCFEGVQMDKLNLSWINMSFVSDLSYTFKDAKIRRLIFPKANTSVLANTLGAFLGAELDYVRMSKFELRNSLYKDAMKGSKIHNLITSKETALEYLREAAGDNSDSEVSELSYINL